LGDGITAGKREIMIRDLAPLCVKKVPVRLEVMSVPAGAEEISIPVSVNFGGVSFADSMRLRVRESGQSLKRTFISRIDSSCQYFAVLPPEGYEPDGEYALILSLHGAGVRAEGQADAYKPKPWAFVVAPTNRRPFGFDWQDWGRLDALEVLEIARGMYPIDDSRIYLTGHSMGGHGVWHVGLHHPDLFAAMAPEAGWTSFELYIPWFLQKSYIYGDPRAVGMRDLSLREDKPLNFVENAGNLGVFIVHGGVDDNVPTMHGRMFAGRLTELGYDYKYWEVPGRGHWWHDDSLDVSCVDYPEVMDFLGSHSRYPAPREIRFRTVNLGTASGAYWAEISAQEEPMRDTEIRVALTPWPAEAGLEEPDIVVSTRNVAEFSLSPPADLLAEGPVRVLVDGEEHSMRFEEGSGLTFAKRAGRFRPGRMERGGLSKSPDLYGPVKQAYFSPFILIYGTRAGREVTDKLLHQARAQAFRWWRRGNGYVDVIPDTAATSRVIEDTNLILFGGPSENRMTERIGRHLPIRVASGGIEIGDHLIEGQGLAARLVYPNPLSPDKLVVVHMGTDIVGLGLADFFKTIYAGAGLPDYVIYDQSVLTKGWAGVICTGFFDNAWKVDPGLMFLAR
jgi:dienelactone hydrolase